MKYLTLLLILCSPATAADYFHPVKPGRVFSFPADHNLHPNFQTEWWYVTANLRGEDGLSYGAQFTLFSNTLMIAKQPQRIFFAHAALSTPKQFYHAERYARADMGHGGIQAKPWRLFLDHWQFNGTGEEPLPGQLTVSEGKFAYDLSLSESRYFLVGEQGFSKKNADGSLASYYYNAPFIKINGTVHFADKAVKVQGQGWLDREWSSGLFAAKSGVKNITKNIVDKVGWDWLSLHLDDNTALMLYRVRSTKQSEKDRSETYLTGIIITASGQQTSLSAAQINWQPTRFKTFADKQYPIGWQLKIPSQQVDIAISPINDDQYLHGFTPYWEGAIKTTGSHKAQGYLEVFNPD